MALGTENEGVETKMTRYKIIVNPVSGRGAGESAVPTIESRLPINDFNWEADLKNLPQSELDRTKPIIQRYINDVVDRALRNSNLTPS